MNDDVQSLWIASVPGVAHRLGDQRVLFQPAGGGAGQVITTDVLRAMGACRTFRPLADQVARIRTALPQLLNRDATIRHTLEQLLARGLFISPDAVAGRLASGDGTGAFDSAPPIVVRTCDRPGLLARLLASAREYERRSGRQPRWMILDDSRTLEGRDGNRTAVERAADGGLDVHWLGEDQQRRYVDALQAGTGVPSQLLEWLLLGQGAGTMTTGRTLNLALLLTAGKGLCVLDEDFRLDATLPPNISRVPRFGDDVPLDVYFLDGADAAATFGVEQLADPLAVHLDLCGQLLGSVLGGAHVDSWHPACMAGCEPADWRYLCADSRVIATVYGTRGSPVSQSAHWLHFLDDTTGSFSRFSGDAEGYAGRADAQWIARTRHQPAVLEAALTMPLTLDNRELLPCTLPAGRGEDRVLTTAIAALYPQHVMLDYPDAWLHQREEGRAHGTANQPVLDLSLCDLVTNFFAQARTQARSQSPGDRLAGLACVMADLASASEAVRYDVFREAVNLRRSALVTGLQDRIDAFAGPSDHPWMADARKLVEANRQAMINGDIHRFRDRDDIDNREGVAGLIGDQCGRYARALEMWPVLWAYCQQSPIDLKLKT